MNSALSAAFSSAKQSDGEFSFRADVTRTLTPGVSSYRSGIASEIRRTLKNFVLVRWNHRKKPSEWSKFVTAVQDTLYEHFNVVFFKPFSNDITRILRQNNLT